MKGIEPSYAAWEAAVLPLNYTRSRWVISMRCGPSQIRTLTRFLRNFSDFSRIEVAAAGVAQAEERRAEGA